MLKPPATSTSPTRFPAGTRTSVKRSSAMSDALIPIFPRSLDFKAGTPGLHDKNAIPFGPGCRLGVCRTENNEMRCDTAVGDKHLVPVYHIIAHDLTAVVVIPKTSLPASGSVMAEARIGLTGRTEQKILPFLLLSAELLDNLRAEGAEHDIADPRVYPAELLHDEGRLEEAQARPPILLFYKGADEPQLACLLP